MSLENNGLQLAMSLNEAAASLAQRYRGRPWFHSVEQGSTSDGPCLVVRIKQRKGADLSLTYWQGYLVLFAVNQA